MTKIRMHSWIRPFAGTGGRGSNAGVARAVDALMDEPQQMAVGKNGRVFHAEFELWELGDLIQLGPTAHLLKFDSIFAGRIFHIKTLLAIAAL